MYNSFQQQDSIQPQGTGYYPQSQQLQPHHMQYMQPQPQPQLGSEFGSFPQNPQSAFSNVSQMQTQPATGLGNNSNRLGMNTFGSNYYSQQLQQPQQPQHQLDGSINLGASSAPVGGTSFGGMGMQQPQLQSMQAVQSQSTGFLGNSQPQQPPLQSASSSHSMGSNRFPGEPQQPAGQVPSQVLGLQPMQSMQSMQSMQPMQPMQPQGTGYYQQGGMQLQQQQMGSQPLQPVQPQQTGFYTQQGQVQLEPLKPTATGFINTFANNGINNDLKIPVMRLSFITAQDQAKFETLFRSQVTKGSNTISSASCRNILMKSGLKPTDLARIWTLCDTSRAGELLFPEFALAMHLVNNVLQGDSVPFDLQSKTKNEVASFIDAINAHIVAESNATSQPQTPFDNLIASGFNNLQPQSTGMIPPTSFGTPLQAQLTGSGMLNPQLTGSGMLNPQSTGYLPQTSFGMPMHVTVGALQPQTTGFMPHTSFGAPMQTQLTDSALLQPQVTGGFTSVLPQRYATGNMPLQATPTGVLPMSNFSPTAPLTAQKTGFGNNEIYSQNNFSGNFETANEDTISAEEKALFYKIFETYDTQKKGLLDSPTAVEIFRKSGLNRSDLEQIWNLCDINNRGQLNKQEFALGMHLVYGKLNGKMLPARLPSSLVPSSNRILDSVKNQLKTVSGNNNPRQSSKTDALSYRNNDDEDVLPSFRNRRKTYSTITPSTDSAAATAPAAPVYVATPAAPVAGVSISSVTTENASKLQQAIREKRARLESEVSRSRRILNQSVESKEADLRMIDSLQAKIVSVPSMVKRVDANFSAELNSRIDAIVTRIPVLFAEISEIEDTISNSKIELYKLQNPSSIVGSGADGEITEEDRKKAKSKALLKSRMAALTGKSSEASVSVEDEEARYNTAVASIRTETNKNKDIIGDIRGSVSEISASLMSTLTGGSVSTSSCDFERWEFGVGLERDVREFIKNLKSNGILAPNSTSSDTVSEFSGNEGVDSNAVYLKEQAQRKMKQKLAEIGIKQSSSASSTEAAAAAVSPFDTRGDVGDSSEDEEERRLHEELDRLKLKKRADKEKRLAMLRQQVQAAQADSDSDEFEDAQSIPGSQSAVSGTSIVPAAPALASQYVMVATGTRSTPVSVPLSTSGASIAANTTGGRDQFFKPTLSTTSSFNMKAAEAQRRSQRGIANNDDDDWSDDEPSHQDGAPKPITAALVPVAAPLLPMNSLGTPPIPVAPPFPQFKKDDEPVVPLAPPLPQIGQNTRSSFFAPPPPLPQMNGNGDINVSGGAHSDNHDVLSIPESVDSEDGFEASNALPIPPTGIPPPPPLP